jgi:hypothetical protein
VYVAMVAKPVENPPAEANPDSLSFSEKKTKKKKPDDSRDLKRGRRNILDQAFVRRCGLSGCWQFTGGKGNGGRLEQGGLLR